MQLLRQRRLLQGVVKNSGNLGGVKAQETKTNFKRETREGKRIQRELGRAEKRRRQTEKERENSQECHATKMLRSVTLIEGLSEAGVRYDRFSTEKVMDPTLTLNDRRVQTGWESCNKRH